MALLRRPNDLPREFTKEIQEDTKLKIFLKDLGFNHSEIKMLQVFVSKSENKNNQRASLDYLIQNNDVLFITIPVGGG